jgi:hypothetical protein
MIGQSTWRVASYPTRKLLEHAVYKWATQGSPLLKDQQWSLMFRMTPMLRKGPAYVFDGYQSNDRSWKLLLSLRVVVFHIKSSDAGLYLLICVYLPSK